MKRVTEQIMYRKESEVDDILSKDITDCYLLIFRKFYATVTDNLHIVSMPRLIVFRLCFDLKINLFLWNISMVQNRRLFIKKKKERARKD